VKRRSKCNFNRCHLCFIDLKKQFQLQQTIIMETGGMKGRRKKWFGRTARSIMWRFWRSSHPFKYSMTNYFRKPSRRNGVFECPAWMQILVRDTEDALTYIQMEKTAESTWLIWLISIPVPLLLLRIWAKKKSQQLLEVLGRLTIQIFGCNFGGLIFNNWGALYFLPALLLFTSLCSNAQNTDISSNRFYNASRSF
jgi:hypothetical protein